jgi:hypothetical protein
MAVSIVDCLMEAACMGEEKSSIVTEIPAIAYMKGLMRYKKLYTLHIIFLYYHNTLC